MKNYKGYDKTPYCSAHYPQMKATMVSDTPELQRIAQNTKIQSQVKYHEDFEKNIRGSKIQVSDDPEMTRVKQVNHLVSQLEYKSGKDKVPVKVEERRQSLSSSMTSQLSSGERRLAGASAVSNGSTDQTAVKPSPYSERTSSYSKTYCASGQVVEGVPRVSRVGSIADYDPVNENYGSLGQGYRPSSTTRQSQSQEWEETVPMTPPTLSTRSSASSALSTSGIGSSSEHEHPQGTTTSALPSSHTDDVFSTADSSHSVEDHRDPPVSSPVHHRGDEEEEIERKSEEYNQQENKEKFQESPAEEPVSNESKVYSEKLIIEEQTTSDNKAASPNDNEEENADSGEDEPGTSLNDAKFIAVYEYEAQDEDEVGFVENDHLIKVRVIDDGWMYGTVERTGQRGMFPSNYVEKVE